MNHNSYRKLGITLLISFCIMYGVMFLNVDDSAHVYLSVTRAYMSLLMVTPMAILMLVMMGGMYPNKRRNRTIMSVSTIVFLLALICLRSQVFIGDRQYMRAMIPHHSSAILTSKHADIKDPRVKELSKGIIESQEREIAEMKAYLEE